MFRRPSASRHGHLFTSLYRRKHILGLTAASLVTFHCSRRTIFADESDRNSRAVGAAIFPSPMTRRDEEFVKASLWGSSASGNILNAGISRFDRASLSITTPSEEYASISIVTLSSGDSWTLLGHYDGWDGWENMSALVDRLLPALTDGLLEVLAKFDPPVAEHTEVGDLPDEEPPPKSYDDAVNNKMKEVFVAVDDGIVYQPFFDVIPRTLSQSFSAAALAANFAVDTIDRIEKLFWSNFDTAPQSEPPSKSEITGALGAALSGSSALVAFYESGPRLLRVALTGNSRAVLGRRAQATNGHTSYEVHVLTAEQDRNNPAEVARLRSQNPGESLSDEGHGPAGGMTRAFGFAAFKWGRELQEHLHREYMGDSPLAHATTPSYLSAEPEITTIEVKPGDFLVLAGSGLWKSLTNEEVVGLVGLWLNRDMATASNEELITVDAYQNPIRPKDLPVSLGTDNTVMYSRWGAEKNFFCVDSNPATHLARNALGGANIGLTASLLSLKPPRVAKYRFDIIFTLPPGTDQYLPPLLRQRYYPYHYDVL